MKQFYSGTLALVMMLFAGLFSQHSIAQSISFSGSYSQDFDGLANTGSGITWTNGSSPLAGWYLFRIPSPGTAITTYTAGTGSSTAGSFYSFGPSGSTDRALGGLGSGGTYFGSPSSGNIGGWMALALTNATANTINSIDVAFDGEQWRNGGNATDQTMVLEYGLGADFSSVSVWTQPGNDFNFTSPLATTTAGAVDGNTAGKQTGLGGTLSNLYWEPGETLWIRWVERNDAGNDHGLAIDDFSVSIPGADVPPTITVLATDDAAAEAGSNTGTFRISRTGSTTSALSVTYQMSGSATNGTDYTPMLNGTVDIPAGETGVDIIITPVDDADVEGNETAVLTISPMAAYIIGSAAAATINIADNDFLVTKIHTIQGNAGNQLSNISGSGVHNDRSPLEGTSVVVEGIVTAVYNDLNAFFLQEEDADTDGDPTTSEGIFVFTGSDPAVVAGDKVKVIGTVDEFFGMTQLDSDNGPIEVVVVSSGNPLPTPVSISLPIAAGADVDDFYEQYEGMLVMFSQKMVVSEYFEVPRFGNIMLTANSRPYQYTHSNLPNAAGYANWENELRRQTILLDDENNIQNAPLPDGVFYYPQPGGFGTGTQGVNFYRGGDAINNLAGVLHWSFAGQSGTDAWRIRPVAQYPVEFTTENPRPIAPAVTGGNVKVASFNVLNYFTTLNSRGANSADELNRQTQKLVSALIGIDADVIGLLEIENNNNGALQYLVEQLNAATAAGTWSFVPTGTVGTDAITCAVIYKTASVGIEGTVAILDDPYFTNPLNYGDGQQNRPAIAVSFKVIAAGNPDLGGIFTLVINHLKSKGGSGASGADQDANDGQSQFNATRTLAASALASWLQTDPTGAGDPDYIIMGDLNSYKLEDPITAFKNAGYTDIIESYSGNSAYGYLFDGMLGYLDHALANSSLLPQVKGVTEWHINADEVSAFDYNNYIQETGEASFDRKPTGNNLFEANAFRTSDHDPVIVGLDLIVPCVIICPEDIVVNNDAGLCGATVNYTVTATGDCGILTYSIPSGTFLAVGEHTVNVLAASGASCSFNITVKDAEAPVIHTIAAPIVITAAPNHKYQTFALADFITSITDNCSALGLQDVKITKVSSDEAENASDDGNTYDDIMIGSDCKTVMLRKERSGAGNGRVYTIYFEATDVAGNTGNAMAYVQIPLNKNGSQAVDDGASYEVAGNCGMAAYTMASASKLAIDELTVPGTILSAYPNPAGAMAQIRYTLATNAQVALTLRNMDGSAVKLLQSGQQKAGAHTVHLNTANLAAGLYIADLRVSGSHLQQERKTTKLIIIH